MADNFFEDKTVEDTQVQDQKVEVPETVEINGEKYTQAELSRLVGLGKIGDEAETKYKTRIDRVWPEYTKATQKIQDLETKLAERQQQQVAEKQTTGQQLSPEEQAQWARKQARDLGIMTQEDFDQMYVQRRSAERLLEDVGSLVKDVERSGKPATDVETILRHMQETGIKNPEKAYKDLYEEQLDKWKEVQVSKAKPNGLITSSASTAGSKEPRPVKVTKENLGQLVSDALSGL